MCFYVSDTTHVLEVNWCLRSLFNRKHCSQSLQKPLDPKPVRNSIGTPQHIYIYIHTHTHIHTYIYKKITLFESVHAVDRYKVN